jgi:hypothetical protein
MKFRFVSLSLLSFSALLPFTPSFTPAAKACLVYDVNTQVAIHGSQTPAQQENNVTTGSDDNCFNNVAGGTNTQVGIGAGEVQQNRDAEYFVGGGNQNNTGLTTPTITVTPSTQVDVYSPAHDPNFIKSVTGQQ